jgi:hypothetical protein
MYFRDVLTIRPFVILLPFGGVEENRPMKNPPLAVPSVLAISLILCLPLACVGSGTQGYHRGKVAVAILPGTASVQVGQSQQFTATVSGTNDTALNWLVNGTLGGNSVAGTISSSGLYTAPAAAASSSVTVTAQSVVKSTAAASATVSITQPTSISVSIAPTSASVQVGQSKQFTATVSGTSNTATNWLVNGSLGGNSVVGTISSSGLYTAPAAAPSSSVTVMAQSVAQSTISARATVSITQSPSISVSISPTSANVQVGQSQQFTAGISGTSYTSVNWLVSGILSGNSLLGTVSSTGLYTAPASVPTSQVTVTAQSTYQPSSSATAGVTITAPVAHYVALSWTDSSPSLAGYNIYRGTQPTGPFVKINSALEPASVYTDNTVVSGRTYYYATTAVDSNNVESGYSNVAQAVIP